ncbi:hypothetical protein [uncultured Alistipes sp.]|uniref:hypothetical protein n=1 Tax=uncultured Alistipes sp. TaxID=538949 RepID=UPI002602FBC5|nr:hypothetical protein [uncultured Alistipes sp.]
MKELTVKQTLQLYNIARNTQQGMGLGEIAFITLMRICRDYVDPSRYPVVPDREKWMIERLNKFRIRFFEKI